MRMFFPVTHNICLPRDFYFWGWRIFVHVYLSVTQYIRSPRECYFWGWTWAVFLVSYHCHQAIHIKLAALLFKPNICRLQFYRQGLSVVPTGPEVGFAVGLPVVPTGPEVGFTVGLPVVPTGPEVGFTVGLPVVPTGPEVGFTVGLPVGAAWS